MRKSLYKYIINRLKESSFILFLLVAFLVWYINRLNSSFQQDVMLPLHIEGVQNPQQNEKQSYFEIFCRAEAKGYEFLQLRLFPASQMITLSLSEIGTLPVNIDGYSNLDISKIEGKIAGKLKGIDIIRIFDDNIELPLSVENQKMVKVSPNIELDLEGGYMQLEKIRITPDSILISGKEELINSIDSVFTRKKSINTLQSRIKGSIELVNIPGVSYSSDIVDFDITTNRFVENKYHLKYKIINKDTTIKTELFSSPSSVEIGLNIAQNIAADFSPIGIEVYALYSDSTKIGDNLYELKVDGLPKGVTLQFIEPRFVTILKQK